MVRASELRRRALTIERESGGEARFALQPETEAMVRDVERMTGRPVVIEPAPGLDVGHASYVLSDADKSRDLIRISPLAIEHRDHLIAHELGHVRLFHQTPGSARVVPQIGQAERRLAFSMLNRELPRVLSRGLTDKEIGRTFELWSRGLVTQLANAPQDILIETHLWETQPEHRGRQRAYLEFLASDAHRLLTDRVQLLSPPTVARASNAMNHVLLKHVGALLEQPGMTRPYQGTPFEDVGNELDTIFSAIRPDDLVGAVQVSNVWSAKLGVSGWFRWGPFLGHRGRG